MRLEYRKNKKREESVESADIQDQHGSVLALFFFGFIWNGIVWMIVLQMLGEMRRGNVSVLFILLFLTPFIGAGIKYMIIPIVLRVIKFFGLLDLHIDIRFNISKMDLPPIIPPMLFWGGAVHIALASFLIVTGLISPSLKWLEMKRWETTPCEVVSSKVIEGSIKGKSAYSLDVLYIYRYGHINYTGTKYSAVLDSTFYEKYINRLMSDIPAGTKTACYVNLLNPAQAVLTRDIRTPQFASGGFGALLLVFGALFVGLGTRQWIKDNRPRSAPLQRPERIVAWLLLLIGWSIFSAALLIGDACQQEVEQGNAYTPPLIPILILGGVGLIFLFKMLYNIFVRWDKVIKLSENEFYEMYEQVRQQKGHKENNS